MRSHSKLEAEPEPNLWAPSPGLLAFPRNVVVLGFTLGNWSNPGLGRTVGSYVCLKSGSHVDYSAFKKRKRKKRTFLAPAMSLGLLCWQEKECSSGRHSCWWPAAASAPAAPPQQEKGQRPPLRPVPSSPFEGVRFHQGVWSVTPSPAYSCPFCKIGPNNSPDLLLCTVWRFQRGSTSEVPTSQYLPLPPVPSLPSGTMGPPLWVSLYSTGWSLVPSLGGFPSSPRPCCSFRVFIALVIK